MRLSTASSPKPPSKGLSLGRIFLSEDFIFVSFGFLAFFILYSLQVVLSVTIVSMVRTPILLVQNSTNSNSTNATSTKPLMRNPNAEFDWSEQLRGVILGSYFWGYASTQLPGGYLAEKYGSKHIMAGSVLITSILTIVSPWAARFSYIAFIACRILEGMFEGVAYPAMHSMIAKWFDKSHRGSMSTIIYIGAQFGTVFTMCVTGILIHSEILGGWPAPFYLLGVLGILWTIGWSLWVKEEPTRIISICELELVQETPNTPGTPGRSLQPPPEEPQKKTPWKQIFTSVPVWALVIAHFGQSWGYFTLLLQLPSYFDRVLGFHIKKNGLLSAVPYLGQAITGCLASYFFDYYLLKRRIMEVDTIRKLSNSIAFLGPAACLILVTVIKCNQTWNMILFTVALSLDGFCYSGFHVTHVDMSPDHAGSLMGLTSEFGNLAGIIAPYVVGLLTQTEVTVASWAYVFFIAAGLYIFSALIFIAFGSAKLQDWGQKPKRSSL